VILGIPGAGSRGPVVEVVTGSVEDLAAWGAVGVASAIRADEVSSREVVEALLDRIARYNPSLNAIVTLDEVGARARADLADGALARGEVWGPLHGVPVTFKDVFETAGMRTTSSHKRMGFFSPR
jgi:amidase